MPERTMSIQYDRERKNSHVTSIDSTSKEGIVDDVALNIANVITNVFENYGIDFALWIENCCNSKNYRELYLTLVDAQENGVLHLGSQITLSRIFRAISPIAASEYEDDEKKGFIEMKLAFGSLVKEFAGLYDEITFYLNNYGNSISAEKHNAFAVAQANAASQQGKVELAYSLYKKLIAELTDYGSLAWAHRGMALTLKDSIADSMYHEEKAADYFLLNGDKQRYASCKGIIADQLKCSDPAKAIEKLDEAMSVFDESDESEKTIIAGMKLSKAKIFHLIGSDDQATAEARQSISLYDPSRTFGHEPALIAAIACNAFFSNEDHAVSQVEDNAEITSLEKRMLDNDKKEYTLRKKLLSVLDSKNIAQLDALNSEITAINDHELTILFGVIRVLIGGIGFIEKLEILESLIICIDKKHTLNEIKALVYNLMAEAYLGNNDEAKAMEWYAKSLSNDPFPYHCRHNYLSLLWNNNLWQQATQFLQDQIKFFGEQPSLMFAYGKSLVEIGDYNKAVRVLRRAQILNPDKEYVTEYLIRAIDKCDNIASSNASVGLLTVTDATIKTIETCLVDFSEHVKCEARMTFWKSASKGHEWRSAPEKHAQTLLHVFMKSRFDGIEILEEIATGAGRIDLYITFRNGFKTIVELKMCGNGYSSGYSAEGVKQLEHYLDNKKLHMGYLVIFDGRKRDFSKGIEKKYTPTGKVIRTFVIDVRPSVK